MKLTTYYRGQNISPQGLNALTAARKTDAVFYSKSFLSVTHEKSVAERFIRGTTPALFEIEGFSASYVNGKYSVRDEVDSVFTPHADFVVTAVETRSSNKNQYLVKLKEVRAHNGSRTPIPY